MRNILYAALVLAFPAQAEKRYGTPQISYPITVDKGGTGNTSAAQWEMFYGDGTNTMVPISYVKNEVLCGAKTDGHPLSCSLVGASLNQVLVAASDGYTFSLPQDIGLASTVKFGRITDAGELTVIGTTTLRGNNLSVGTSSFTIVGGTATVAYQLTAGSLITTLGSTIRGQETVVSSVTFKDPSFSIGASTFIVSGGTATFGGRVNFSSAAVFLPLNYSTNTIGQSAIFYNGTTNRLSAYENGGSTRPILTTPTDQTYTYRTGTASAACAAATIRTSTIGCEVGEYLTVPGCLLGGAGGSEISVSGGAVSTSSYRCDMDCLTAAGTETVQASANCVR